MKIAIVESNPVRSEVQTARQNVKRAAVQKPVDRVRPLNVKRRSLDGLEGE